MVDLTENKPSQEAESKKQQAESSDGVSFEEALRRGMQSWAELNAPTGATPSRLTNEQAESYVAHIQALEARNPTLVVQPNDRR